MPRYRNKTNDFKRAPDWLVLYGDMMSLLLVFFVCLVSFSTVSEEEFKKAMTSIQTALNPLPGVGGGAGVLPKSLRTSAGGKISGQARRLQEKLQVMGLDKEVKVEYDARGGLKINLPASILFDTGVADIRTEAFPVLREVASVLKSLPDTFIEVRGHTDNSSPGEGSRFRDNYDLSYFRANTIMRQLQSFERIPVEQFELISCGNGQPMASNETEEGRRANRRVEIYVRGLVDKSKVESIDNQSGDKEQSVTGAVLIPPISPRELQQLR